MLYPTELRAQPVETLPAGRVPRKRACEQKKENAAQLQTNANLLNPLKTKQQLNEVGKTYVIAGRPLDKNQRRVTDQPSIRR